MLLKSLDIFPSTENYRLIFKNCLWEGRGQNCLLPKTLAGCGK